MSADVLRFPFERLPPEAPVARTMTLECGLRAWLAVQMALLRDPSPSELIEELTHTTDPTQRQALADAIARSAP